MKYTSGIMQLNLDVNGGSHDANERKLKEFHAAILNLANQKRFSKLEVWTDFDEQPDYQYGLSTEEAE